MCKVMIMTGIKDSKNALKFMAAVKTEMSYGNRDGIGYSAINSKNQLFMEKWHENDSFLDSEKVVKEVDADDLETITGLVSEANKTLDKYGKKIEVPKMTPNYMSYGEITRDDIRTVTMHTRFATCGREMRNTHPFVDNGVSLIHNGVINNQYQLGLNKISTCDSEVALQLYINKNVMTGNKANYQSFLDQLKGYWAFGILAKNKQGTYMLDVIREGAFLNFAYIPELGEDCIIFATTKDIITAGCKELGFKKPEITTLKESSLTRFNAVTGEIVYTADLEKSSGNKSGYYYGGSYADNFKSENKVSYLNKNNKETATSIIKYDKEKAYVENNLTNDEIEALLTIGNRQQTVYEALVDYDTYLGSNYSIFYNSLSTFLKEDLEKNVSAGRLTLVKAIKVIEEFGDSGYYKANQLMKKLAV